MNLALQEVASKDSGTTTTRTSITMFPNKIKILCSSSIIQHSSSMTTQEIPQSNIYQMFQ